VRFLLTGLILSATWKCNRCGGSLKNAAGLSARRRSKRVGKVGELWDFVIGRAGRHNKLSHYDDPASTLSAACANRGRNASRAGRATRIAAGTIVAAGVGSIANRLSAGFLRGH
jgi:hypothetical protein